jgi:release factor glutamine methyltransferase
VLAAVSGQELWLWYLQAKQQAIASHLSPTEVDWLLQEVAGLSRLELRLETFQMRSSIALKLPLAELEQLWQRRLEEHLPVQYLVGVTPWRYFQLQVSPDVLIPRPETEYLIDLVAQAIREHPELMMGNWVDLGTGSGAIAIGLADLLTKAQVYAVDTSYAALQIAQKNAQNLGFTDRIKFVKGEWWQPLETLRGQFSGMISNPPYIPTSLIPQLQPEVAKHEPHLALDGGVDGLDCIRHLVKTAPDYLISGGIWLIEMMAGQAETVQKLLQEQGNYYNIKIYQDLAGIERFALAYRC